MAGEIEKVASCLKGLDDSHVVKNGETLEDVARLSLDRELAKASEERDPIDRSVKTAFVQIMQKTPSGVANEVKRLADINRIKDPNVITAGQRIFFSKPDAECGKFYAAFKLAK